MLLIQVSVFGRMNSVNKSNMLAIQVGLAFATIENLLECFRLLEVGIRLIDVVVVRREDSPEAWIIGIELLRN